MNDNDQALIAALRRAVDPIAQSAIIEEIGARELVAAVELLIEFVRRNDFPSGPAIAALGQIGDPRAVEVLVGSFEFQNLAWIAKDALVKIGDAALEPLLRALHAANPDVRFAAIRTLGELRDPRALTGLETFIQQEHDATNRQIARTTYRALLLRTLTHPAPAWRLAAVRGLERLNDARTVDTLAPLAARDRDGEVRAAAHEAVISLVAGVQHDPFEEHSFPLCQRETRLAINHLRQHAPRDIPLPDSPDHTPATLAALQAAADDDALTVPARDCVRRLALDCLRHPDATQRTLGIAGLRWLGGGDARAALEPLAAHDPDPAVCAAAQDALRGA